MMLTVEHCRIVSPGTDIPDGSLCLENGRITYAGPARPAAPGGTIIDGTGLIAVPGFVDIHSHGRSGYDFCDASLEAFTAIGRGKLQDGVTSFLATSLSVADADLRQFCHAAKAYSESVHDGATLLGIHLEGPFFPASCAGAQNPAFLKNPDIALVDELNAIFPIKKVSYAPELPGGMEFTQALVQRGIMPSGAHSEADYQCFRQHYQAGMRHLTHFCNVMTPLHHLRFGMVGGGLTSREVWVEIICDGVHLCDEMIQLITQLKGADRIMLITDAMRASAQPDGEYSLGGLPVTVKNGKATLHTGQVAGSTLRYFAGLQRLLRVTGLPVSEAIKGTSLNQVRSLDLGKRGILEPGYSADITLLDQTLTPQMTICDGVLKWSRNDLPQPQNNISDKRM